MGNLPKSKGLQTGLGWEAAFMLAVGLLTAGFVAPSKARAIGTWVLVIHRCDEPVEQMLLLPDGTVMAQAAGLSRHWYRLTPNVHGSYVNGTWTSRQSMGISRYDYASAVLRDGRVFVIGGEYANIAEGNPSQGEIYDLRTDTWKLAAGIPGNLWSAGDEFDDAACMVLPSGSLLISPVRYHVPNGTLIYDPALDSWSSGPTNVGNQNEASWIKLPDDSILTIPIFSTAQTERYNPALNQWIQDADVGTGLYSANGEIGAGFLLPDGRAMFLGGTGHTAIYTPTGNTNQGAWAQGPEIPDSRVMRDSPAAMMVNGKILCVFTPPAPGDSPSYFYEYDYMAGTNGSFTPTSSPGNNTVGSPDSNTSISDNHRMLDLPDGSVLYTNNGDDLWAYQPDGSALASAKPVISNIHGSAGGSYHLSGTGLNGISQGAFFGDDAQMDSNYPLVRITDGNGNVTYARTYNWSSTSVMTGNRPVSTEFTLTNSVNQAAGPYSLVVVANGVASDPVTFESPDWVDFNYIGALQFGTYSFPYKTMAAGVATVTAGGSIFLKPGLSHETMTISKSMTIVAVGGTATIGR
jgi:hypothetical protein